jgi:hypothetical protein
MEGDVTMTALSVICEMIIITRWLSFTFWLLGLVPEVKQLRDEISSHLNDGRRGEILREGQRFSTTYDRQASYGIECIGVRIALAGLPNAGKSSLLNSLAKRPAAIVSPIAGTTRWLHLSTLHWRYVSSKPYQGCDWNSNGSRRSTVSH